MKYNGFGIENYKLTDVFENIIEGSLRKAIDILSITNVSGTDYSVAIDLTSNQNIALYEGCYIHISNTVNFNELFKVSNLDLNAGTFNIVAGAGLADEFAVGEVKLSIYFLYGNQNYIFNQLVQKNNTNLKYPLICLYLDITENIFVSDLTFKTADLIFSIVAPNSLKWKNDMNIAKIKSELDSIFNSFYEAILSDKLIQTNDNYVIPYSVTDVINFGNEYKNIDNRTANLVPDTTNAKVIEFDNMKFNYKYICETN